jgi:membrane-associated phospholipid phosphatase
MVPAQLTRPPTSLHRRCIASIAVAVTLALFRPAYADDSGVTLGQPVGGADAFTASSALLAASPEVFDLGKVSLVPATPVPAAAPTDVPTAPGVAPGAGQARTVPSPAAFPRRVWQDFGVLVGRPLAFDSRDWTRLALGAGLVGVVAAFDNRLRDTIQAHSSASSRALARRIQLLGGWGGIAAMGILYGAGELSGDANLAGTGADGLEATLFSAGVITPVIKEIAGRPRPNAGQGSGDFEPISAAQSFPSGDATEAFALAAVVSHHTESPVVRGLAWGLAGLVGWERMELDAHWASDIAAGALIGATVGDWVSERSRLEGHDGHSVAFTPVVGPGVVGVSGSISW